MHLVVAALLQIRSPLPLGVRAVAAVRAEWLTMACQVAQQAEGADPNKDERVVCLGIRHSQSTSAVRTTRASYGNPVIASKTSRSSS